MKYIDRDEFARLVTAVHPRLWRGLRFVPEKVQDWQDRDFVKVTNKSHTQGVLIVPLDTLYVVPFRLYKRTPNNAGRVEAVICDICATWQPGTHSAVLTLEKETKSVSFLVCSDLNCSLHVRGKTLASERSRAQLRETISTSDKIARLTKRLAAMIGS